MLNPIIEAQKIVCLHQLEVAYDKAYTETVKYRNENPTNWLQSYNYFALKASCQLARKELQKFCADNNIESSVLY